MCKVWEVAEVSSPECEWSDCCEQSCSNDELIYGGHTKNDPPPKCYKAKVKHFYLWRKVDETGMSGTGKVAEGVELPNGVCVMWWIVDPYSVVIYKDIKELEHIHSHGRKTTEVIFEEV